MGNQGTKVSSVRNSKHGMLEFHSAAVPGPGEGIVASRTNWTAGKVSCYTYPFHYYEISFSSIKAFRRPRAGPSSSSLRTASPPPRTRTQ